jgi:hypothetical protein
VCGWGGGGGFFGGGGGGGGGPGGEVSGGDKGLPPPWFGLVSTPVPGEGVYSFVFTPIPALLSGLTTLLAHVPCSLCFHMANTIPSCVLLLCVSFYSLSLRFPIARHLLLRHLGLCLIPLSTFAVVACILVLLPVPGTFFGLANWPFASPQYLYCSSV